MKLLLIPALLLICSISFSQVKKDSTAKPLPDSLFETVIKDTVVFKIPKELAAQFENLLYGKDYSHKAYLQLMELWQQQMPGFLVKRRKINTVPAVTR